MFNWLKRARKPKVYYARPIDFYWSNREREDLKIMEDLGFDVIEIRSDEIQAAVKKHGMDVFKPLVESADLFIFRTFPDGTIGAGVAKERAWAVFKGLPVLEWAPNVQDRVLSVSETRLKLKLDNLYTY